MRPGGPTGGVGGLVRIFAGENFEPIATLAPEGQDVRFGESVAAMPDSTPGAGDTLLVSEMQYVARFPVKTRARITTWDPRSSQRTTFFASDEESDGESYRILSAHTAGGFVVARESALASRELRSVSAVTTTGVVRWQLECAELFTPDTHWTNSIAVLDDTDGDGLSDALIATLCLRDDGKGTLYSLSSKSPSSRRVLHPPLVGLRTSIATARDSRTGRMASIAVGACHPAMPFYQGQVILLEPKDLGMLRFARRTGPGHSGVRVDGIDGHRES